MLAESSRSILWTAGARSLAMVDGLAETGIELVTLNVVERHASPLKFVGQSSSMETHDVLLCITFFGSVFTLSIIELIRATQLDM